MDVELEVVGRRVNELRKAGGLRLSDLAAATGYTTSYISQIERGTTLPSLTAMATLALALGVEMTAFIENPASPDVVVTRAGGERELRLGGGITYWIHGTVGGDRSFSAMVQEIPKSDQSYRHYGERFVLVLDGSIELSIGDSTEELHRGGTVHYGAHQEHVITAKTDDSARVFIVSAPGIL